MQIYDKYQVYSQVSFAEAGFSFGEEIILDVVDETSEHEVKRTDLLVLKYQEGVFSMRFLVPPHPKEPRGSSMLTQFPGIDLPEDHVKFAVAFTEELAKEFTKKHFNKDLVVPITADSVEARHVLGKTQGLVSKFRSQFSWKFINQLRPKSIHN